MVAGWRDLQMSTTPQFLKRERREALLSLEGSAAFEPLLSIDLSKTALKSPQTTVATDGSIFEETKLKKVSLSGFWLGA